MTASVAIQDIGTFHFLFPEEGWAGSFNCYEVQRSRFGDAGPWEDLHALSGSRGARFYIESKPAYDVDGLELELIVDRTQEVTVLFSGTTPADVTASFNNVMPSIITAENASMVVVSALSVGHDSSIEIIESDVSTKLGLVPRLHLGASSCPALVPGQEAYTFVDPAAQDSWYYRARYLHRTTGAVGLWGVPVPARANVAIDPSELIKGEIYVTDPTGKPVQNVLILLDVQADSSTLGMLPMQLQQFTDIDGYASILVRRGVTAVFSVAGTGIARKILVPSTGATFDLADFSLSTQPDAFAVQVPNIKVGERRSM